MIMKIMKDKIQNLIKDALKNIGLEVSQIALERPEDLKNGDYFTNVALACAKKVAMNPQALAEKIVVEILRLNLDKNIKKVTAAGAGFINFYLSRKFFAERIEEILNQGEKVGENNTLSGKKIMVEYTDPNPFKPFHIGHLMTNAIGESIARVLENSGAVVSRANYQGDIGLHIAKAIWGLQKRGLPDKNFSIAEQAKYIGNSYVLGSEAYEKDLDAKKEIEEINKKLYKKSNQKINEIYEWGFKTTMEAFEDLYRILGTKFDFYFLESQMASIGEHIVRTNLGKVFQESDGAIVFKGEDFDPKLHTRVFITAADLPTYEAKELGLAAEKFKTEPDLNLSIIVTANEQLDYMKVVAKALSLIHPEYENKILHIIHGMMRFASGKMSSRKGNVVTGESLIRETILLVAEKLKERDYAEEEKKKIAEVVSVAALKYSILKQNAGGDIVYDFEKSISFEGDSGPYLQYSYARANSVLEKAKTENILPDFKAMPSEIFEVEKLLDRFEEVAQRSAALYEPHYVANYLIELARAFNSFYASAVIADQEDKTSPYKVALTFVFALVMKKGLHLLGLEAPEKM